MSKKTISDALKSFSERYYTLRLPAATINEFGVALDKYIQKVKKAVDANASEETIKNIVNRFLSKNFYSETEFEVNAHGSIDSAIMQDDNLLALIETKRPINSNEMVRENDLNKKALWELTFYYLSETRDVSGSKVKRVKDVEIRRLIITDSIRWALFDANSLEGICDGYLEKLYYKYKNGQLTYANDNPKFYEDIKNHFEKIDITKCLDYLYLDFESLYKQKKNWQYIYKILQREFLLKFGYKQEVKAHILNERFYQELLYIMGLRETKENNMTLIKIDSGIENSFAAQVFKKYVDDKDFPEEKAIDRTFELIIIWINRLLFIKLFEGQLVAFNSNEDCYHILDNSKIKDFQNLQDLFFNVLGKKKREESSFYNQFVQIPYLNSSLFERQAIEARDININELKNEPVIKKPHSILGSKGSKAVPLLEYIINFLNSYSFSAGAADSDGLSIQRQEIIDAAVLGLIFEKLNGYIKSHPVSFQEEESMLNYYCVRLIGEFISYTVERFSLEKKGSLSKTLDIVTLRDLYRKISAIIGSEEQMERLNLLLRQRFLVVTPIAAFLQGLTTDLLLNLTYRDPESSKQIFQFILDNG